MDFTQEERMLMMIYNPGSREKLVVELETMKGQLCPGERRLLRRKPGGISGRTGNNEGAASPRRETASASDRYRDR